MAFSEAIPEQVDFIFHVKPILSDRCFACHGPDKNKAEAGLQLHSEETAFAASTETPGSFAIIPGDAENSLIIQRIFSSDPNEVMPPAESNLNLSEREKTILKKWVEQGAEWKEHWAFKPPVAPTLPTVNQKDWVNNDIDNFILSKLETYGIAPSEKIKGEKLLRRLSFDLRGLPPSLPDVIRISQIEDADKLEKELDRLIDEYLSSDAYAERMTAMWMDVARYGDTHGYQDDFERTMWPWRDWVIHAFKKNLPYNEFVTWQLAGDLLPNATKEQIIATAFNRNHKITQEGGIIPEEYRTEYVSDRTNTFATAFIGLTFECAKCHDHKYDPISQKDYFQLYSYFNNVTETGIPGVIGETPEPYVEITDEEIESVLSFINNQDNLDKIPLMVMKELDKPREAHILNRGVYDQIGEPVHPEIPSLGSTATVTDYKDRKDLSNWLFEEKNPLTARVMVNRLWQQIFGRGIVATSEDFGNQGRLPTHPELLDHLAVEFRKSGWDMKAMIKYMVSSATYQQSSKIRTDLSEMDQENNLLARSTRNRLSAEMIRDHALSISGLLVKEVGGPSVKPYQPPGLWAETTGGGGGSTANYIQDKGDKNYRRSLYTFWKRTVPPPNMLLFDSPTRDFCTVRRENTSTPLQALVLLNDPQFLEASKAFAHQAIKETNHGSPENIIQYMFTLATSRFAKEEELKQLMNLYEVELAHFKNEPEAAQAILEYGAFEIDDQLEESTLAVYTFIANTIFNLDETIRKS